MRKMMLFLRLVACLGVFFYQELEASTINLNGRSIATVIPSDSCELGFHPIDEKILSQFKKRIDPSNKVLTAFVNCKELEDRRKDLRKDLDNYGLVLVQTSEGQPLLLKGVSRAEFLQTMKNEIGYFPVALKEAVAVSREFAKQSRSVKSLGALGSDSNGLYIGAIFKNSDYGGATRTVLALTGITLVKEHPITINIYHSYNTEPNLQELLVRIKSVMKDLIAANN